MHSDSRLDSRYPNMYNRMEEFVSLQASEAFIEASLIWLRRTDGKVNEAKAHELAYSIKMAIGADRVLQGIVNKVAGPNLVAFARVALQQADAKKREIPNLEDFKNAERIYQDRDAAYLMWQEGHLSVTTIDFKNENRLWGKKSTATPLNARTEAEEKILARLGLSKLFTHTPA